MSSTERNESENGDLEGDDRTGADVLERIVVVTSTLLITGMLGYVLWQAAMTPAPAEPVATVEAVEPMPDTDRQQVTVRLANRGGRGLTSIQVTVRCGQVIHTLEFTHVPADSNRTGTAVCPTGTDPQATVETWIGA